MLCLHRLLLSVWGLGYRVYVPILQCTLWILHAGC